MASSQFPKMEPPLARTGIAKNVIKSQMQQRKLTYAELSERLTKRGFNLKPNALRNKINRGGFSADFFIIILEEMHIFMHDFKGLNKEGPSKYWT